jgi:hypothetical protein
MGYHPRKKRRIHDQVIAKTNTSAPAGIREETRPENGNQLWDLPDEYLKKHAQERVAEIMQFGDAWRCSPGQVCQCGTPKECSPCQFWQHYSGECLTKSLK